MVPIKLTKQKGVQHGIPTSNDVVLDNTNNDVEFFKLIYHTEENNLVDVVEEDAYIYQVYGDVSFTNKYKELYNKCIDILDQDTFESRTKVLDFIKNNVVLELVDDSALLLPYGHITPISAEIYYSDPDDAPSFDIDFIRHNNGFVDFKTKGWSGTQNIMYIKIRLSDVSAYCFNKYIPVLEAFVNTIRY